MEIHDINAGKYICLFFSRDKAWILREIDERRQVKGLSRTEVLEDLLAGQQSGEAEQVGNMR
jgi:uncharacterized protein (UPF0297 family)